LQFNSIAQVRQGLKQKSYFSFASVIKPGRE